MLGASNLFFESGRNDVYVVLFVSRTSFESSNFLKFRIFQNLDVMPGVPGAPNLSHIIGNLPNIYTHIKYPSFHTEILMPPPKTIFGLKSRIHTSYDLDPTNCKPGD